MNVLGRIGTLAIAVSASALVVGCSQDLYDCEMAGEVAEMTAHATAWTPPAAGAAAPRPVAAITDNDASAMIKSAILAEPGLAAIQIDVDFDHAIITLDGFVDSAGMKARASQIAQSAGGATFVVDNVVVRPSRSGWRSVGGTARSAPGDDVAAQPID